MVILNRRRSRSRVSILPSAVVEADSSTAHIEYRFPVTSGKTYHVFLGLVRTEQVKPGEELIRLSVNGESQVVDVGLVKPGKPIVREFVVSSAPEEIRVKSECDSFLYGALPRVLTSWHLDS